MASDTLKTSIKMGARTLNLQIMLPFPVTVRQKVLFFHYNDIFYSQIECTGTMYMYQGKYKNEIYFLIYHFH